MVADDKTTVVVVAFWVVIAFVVVKLVETEIIGVKKSSFFFFLVTFFHCTTIFRSCSITPNRSIGCCCPIVIPATICLLYTFANLLVEQTGQLTNGAKSGRWRSWQIEKRGCPIVIDRYGTVKKCWFRCFGLQKPHSKVSPLNCL